MIRHGANRSRADKKDYSYFRTHGWKFGGLPTTLPDLEYSYLDGRPIPDQNQADTRFSPALIALPLGCTGEAQTFLKGLQDNALYNPKFTYDKTCLIENHGPEEGCDIRNSSKSLRVFGAQRVDETTNEQAVQHKSGQTFSVDKAPGRDWFDSQRIALRNEKQGISVGTIWFSEWENPDPTGLLSPTFVYDGNADEYSWHNYAFTGEKVINGEPTLEVVSWQGENYAVKGIAYMNRATFNRAFDIYGTIALITAKALPGDVRTIQLDLYQTILDLINRVLILIGQEIPIHA